MPARISYESERGCGYRKVGGLYIVSMGIGRSCGRLPLELGICPTCSGGIHPVRSWTWIDPKPLFEDLPCADVESECETCPVGGPRLATLDRVGLLWIGSSHYPRPEDFTREAEQMGVSRRLPAIPKGFEVGVTWVFVAHRQCFVDPCLKCAGKGKWYDMTQGETVECPDCEGKGEFHRAGIFHAFLPNAIEKSLDRIVPGPRILLMRVVFRVRKRDSLDDR